jgi:MurNAc alpha-1-phosphate uridylyltransferase
MKALILAAGRGERMRPLTDRVPKPLLEVHGKPLVAWHLEALARAGVREAVVNTAWLEEQFPAVLGDGTQYGMRIHYSTEGRDHGGALETAGGIAKALPLLAPHGDDPFWIVSGDIFAPQFDFSPARAAAFESGSDLAHLWLVENPPFHPTGDFRLDTRGRVHRDPADASRPWTYANIALLRPALVDSVRSGECAALGPLLFDAAARGLVGGEAMRGRWENVGTPQQLARLNGSA